MAISPDMPVAAWNLGETQVDVPYAVTGENPDMVFVAGFGETRLTDIARGLGEHGLNVAVFKVVYPADAELSAEVIERSIVDGTNAVIDDLQDRAGQPTQNRMIGLGNSEGAGELIKAASVNPERWSRLVPVAPLGVNNESLHAEPKRRFRELKNRMKEAGLFATATVIDPASAVEKIDSRRLFKEFKSGLDYALQQDGAAMVQKLRHLGLMKHLFVGGDDTIFPPQELERAVGIEGFVRTVKNVGHISMLTKQGIDQMAGIIKLGLDDGGSELASA